MTITVSTGRRVTTDPVECSAAEALAAFARQVDCPSIGFCYSATAARWFRLDASGAASFCTGDQPAGFAADQPAAAGAAAPADLTGVFELRAFTRSHELRWYNTAGGCGPAVVVTEGEDSALRVRRLSGGPYRRLLWGTVAGCSDGWVVLHDARIGALRVPLDRPAPHGARIWLEAVEYVDEDDHGNLAVVDERLVGLVVTTDHNDHEPGRGAER